MDARSETLRVLSRLLVSERSLQETLDSVAEITTAAMPAAAFAGISLLDDSGNAATRVEHRT